MVVCFTAVARLTGAHTYDMDVTNIGDRGIEELGRVVKVS